MKKRVLFIDDEEAIRDIVANYLGEFGFDIVLAASADEAFEKLRTDTTISLLITDICMPGLNGIELAKLVMEKYGDLPIIICSGHPGSIPPQVEAKLYAVLKKPFNFLKLLHIVDSALKIEMRKAL